MAARKKNGFSLVEMVVAMGVGAIMILAFASWSDMTSKQQQALSQKMVSLQIEGTLLRMFSDPVQCTGNMTPLVSWPTGVPPAAGITVPAPGLQLYNGAAPTGVILIPNTGPFSNGYGLNILNIKIQNITPSGAGQYMANVVVNYPTSTPLLAPQVKGVFLATHVVAGLDKLISCSIGTGRTTCPLNYSLVGTPSTEEAFCISSGREAATSETGAFDACVTDTTPHPAGQRGHLCSENEWTEACIQGAIGLPTVQEWVYLPHLWDDGSPPARWNGTVMGGGGSPPANTCTTYDQFHPAIGSPYPFRCCFR